jgi:predicted DNA-binding protein (MmcQ/YjbR family)
MNIEEFRAYCIRKKGVSESFPFDEFVLVFKVMGKMFALANTENFNGFSLKCDPERALELREEYPTGIKAAWHMNKKHWNSVHPEEGLPPQLVRDLIDHSYDLVVASLTKKLQKELKELE